MADSTLRLKSVTESLYIRHTHTDCTTARQSRDTIARIDMFLKYFRDIFNGFIAKVVINFALLTELTLVNIY